MTETQNRLEELNAILARQKEEHTKCVERGWDKSELHDCQIRILDTRIAILEEKIAGLPNPAP